MTSPVRQFTPSVLPPPDRADILRYARTQRGDVTAASLLEELLPSAEAVITPRLCYRTVAVVREGDRVGLDFATVASPSLSHHLSGCTHAVLLVATVGLALDRMIARERSRSPVRALLLGAIGTERVEALCDAFCEALHEAGTGPVARRSPGYADLSLSLQTPLLAFLDAPHRVGVMLSEHLLMSPSKSVSAIVGMRTYTPDLILP